MRPLRSTAIAAAALGVLVAVACGEVACDSSGTVLLEQESPEAGLPPLETKPPAVIPPASRLDTASSPVVFDARRGGVWTANGDAGSVSYVDVVARRVVREVALGSDVRSVALSPDFKWLAAVDRGGAAVALIDADLGSVVRSIPVGTHPRAAVWDSEDPRWLYIAVEDADAVVVVDRTAGAVAGTIQVGRLPSGLAVSRKRAELYVTHRIDAEVTVVDLATHKVTANVAIPVEPANPDPTVPQGTPFAFESLGWTPGGDVVWLPHELLAARQPFQFKETLFATISVVDLAKRAEVPTDPNDPLGAVAGRKNLFAAIDVLDSTGTPSVLSQPCAAVLHPGGYVGYALACASEDLIVFDQVTGIATSLLRNLPGDHPVGLALDDHGDRLFVVSDQSHTLLTFDTGKGSLVGHTAAYGQPILLVASDPVDPELRAGLELFYSANSSKGPLATTANNWMSCGGCHLDGFVSTNQVFFSALAPSSRANDAQIGHVGLVDMFSTAPTPTAPEFNPHDILVALEDQGGLDGDRTGAHPTGVIDPSAPSPMATQMASRLARVVARDLPIGPAWLLDPSPKLDPQYDSKWCGQSGCHQAEYEAWSKSVHSRSADDPMMLYCAGVEQGIRGKQFSRQCAGCHDPVSARLGDTSLTSKRGITCLGCHDVTRTIRAGGNSDLQASSHDWTTDHKDWATASLQVLRDPRFCGGCHLQFVPGTGVQPSFSTLPEWEASPYASASPQTTCVSCHMPSSNGKADHRAIGGNLYMGMRVGAQDVIAGQKVNLVNFAQLTAKRAGGSVAVTVVNGGSGHAFPTGVVDIREAWVELEAMDAHGNVLARIGGPGADGLLPADAALVGTRIADDKGHVLLRHELSLATHLPYDQRAMPQQALTLQVPVPASLPAGTMALDAVLFYRNVSASYYRQALGDASASPPETELARVKVP